MTALYGYMPGANTSPGRVPALVPHPNHIGAIMVHVTVFAV